MVTDGSVPQTPVDSWRLPTLPSYVDSRELEWLKRDIKRYALGRVLGRSYLIAGHRGAGKSALAGRAVDLVASEIVRDAVRINRVFLADEPFQRPLLVKLHGPSMLQEQPAAVTADPPALAPSGTAAGSPSPSTASVATTPNPGAIGPNQSSITAAAAASPSVSAALVQMTVGLYRSLATDIATGYRAHGSRLGSPVKDGAELAAQLALDLDLGADPAALNRYWSAIGRLSGGVLWPPNSDETLARSGMSDQGFREITALATAGQAFQVCTGRVSYKAAQKDSATQAENKEGSKTYDFNDGLSKFLPLGIGAFTGAAVLGTSGGNGGAGILAGLAVWLLGSLTLKSTWSAKRTGDQSVDYSFIRDREPATLDRELPVVIARVRQAGLAPVFVIDELDKVPDAADRLIELVGRLKHLIVDFGFFCFLVNRDCFEVMEAKVRSAPYPAEHTLFSDRLLLRPDPVFTFKYLLDRTSGDPDDVQALLARSVFSLVIMHESRLNLTDVMRLLSRSTRPDDSIGHSSEWVAQRRLVVATVQLAIGVVLSKPALVERMDADAVFGQMAIDAVYYPSRQWEVGVSIDPSRESLRKYLESRLRPDSTHLSSIKLSDEDLSLLHRHVILLLKYLEDLNLLRREVDGGKLVGEAAVDLPGDVRSADVIPSDLMTICHPESDGLFCFRMTRDGEPITTDAHEMTDVQRQQATELLAFSAAFLSVLGTCSIPLDDLAGTPLLSAIYLDMVERARRNLVSALAVNEFGEVIAEHLATLRRLHAEVSRNSESLGMLFVLVASVARDAGSGLKTLKRIQRLLRMDVEAALWLDKFPMPFAIALPTTAAGLTAWAAKLVLIPATGGPTPRENDFARIEPPIRGFLSAGTPRHVKPDYDMLVRCAACDLPARVICADLASMLIGDWSALAVAAMPTDVSPAQSPYWLLIAALRALGFGREALRALSDPALAPSLAQTNWLVGSDAASVARTFEIAGEIAASASDAPAGILVVDSDEQSLADGRPFARRAVLAIREDDFELVSTALRWLGAIGIFAAVADSRPEN